MLKLEKHKRNANYNLYSFEFDNGIFTIHFAGNDDLYWTYNAKISEMKNEEEKKFCVDKNNYFMYMLINKLYDSIINYELYPEDDFPEMYESSEEMETYQALKVKLQKDDETNPERLCTDGVIDYHSDDAPYEKASRLIIKKVEDVFVITFVKGENDMGYPTYSVRICNSGSRYGYFNVCFMLMYRKLAEYNPNYNYELLLQEYHQVNLEEYLSEQKLIRTK